MQCIAIYKLWLRVRLSVTRRCFFGTTERIELGFGTEAILVETYIVWDMTLLARRGVSAARGPHDTPSVRPPTVLQTTTDNDRRQRAKQYWAIRRASNKKIRISPNNGTSVWNWNLTPYSHSWTFSSATIYLFSLRKLVSQLWFGCLVVNA